MHDSNCLRKNIHILLFFFFNGYYRRIFKLLKMSRIAIINNLTPFIDFFFIILMLICVYYFLIDLNYRNIQSTNSTDLHGRSKTKCSVITMATFIWKIGYWLFLLCKVQIDNKYNIPVRIFPGWGWEAERRTTNPNLDPRMVIFFVVVASIRHHDQEKRLFSLVTTLLFIIMIFFF